MNTTDRTPVGREDKVRVLLVDDSADDAELLQAELSMRGVPIEYLRVASALDMAAALAQDDWDVVISDHRMPGFDAFQALETLKRSGKDLPFIIHSGHMSWDLAVAAMYEGVHDFIEKGNYDRLIPVIERELRGARARRAARQADERLKTLANFDHLLALPNRQLFCAKISDWLTDCQYRAKTPRGVLMTLDIDRFLRVNASFGYEAGNRILQAIAARLIDALDADVLLARIGSDVFAVFVPGIGSREGAEVFARWISRAFSAPFMQERVEIFLTTSLGVTFVDGQGGTAFDFLTRAEMAMAVAKKAGGNGFRFYDPALNASSAERMTLEADLRHAIKRDELRLVYQPVVSAEDHCTVSVEALLRWQHPVHGAVAPDRFIPLADETGLIIEIGAWVLGEACRQCKVWHDQGFPAMRVSVNVSAVQFGQPRLLQTVGDALQTSGLPAGSLMLEITESSLMKEPETTAGMLRALKNMGVIISVDDFGTGYSSLSYLKRFPLDIIKIDKSFVHDVCEDEENAAIVRAIIALARSMRRQTIAEGVETEAQSRVLGREECNLFQGYYFGRPMPAIEISRRLEDEASALGESLRKVS
jgi:diguanylate cyclase (GGDEF)-like protein